MNKENSNFDDAASTNSIASLELAPISISDGLMGHDSHGNCSYLRLGQKTDRKINRKTSQIILA